MEVGFSLVLCPLRVTLHFRSFLLLRDTPTPRQCGALARFGETRKRVNYRAPHLHSVWPPRPGEKETALTTVPALAGNRGNNRPNGTSFSPELALARCPKPASAELLRAMPLSRYSLLLRATPLFRTFLLLRFRGSVWPGKVWVFR